MTTTNPNQQLIDDIQGARDLLAKPGGFLHHSRWDHHGGYCSSGALFKTIIGKEKIDWDFYDNENNRDRYHTACSAVAEHMEKPMLHLHPGESWLVTFNNSHSQAEVVGAFDKTLADLGGGLG